MAWFMVVGSPLFYESQEWVPEGAKATAEVNEQLCQKLVTPHLRPRRP